MVPMCFGDILILSWRVEETLLWLPCMPTGKRMAIMS